MEPFWKRRCFRRDDGRGTARDVGKGVGLNDLSDDLLIKIISFNRPVKNAVRTSILSRRWRSLWKCVDTLEVHRSRELQLVKKYWKGKKIREFRFFYNLEMPREGYIAVCGMRFALERSVEKLVIGLECDDFHFRRWPISLLTCETLVHLELRSFEFKSLPRVYMPALKFLVLDEAEAIGSALVDFISGCPSLGKLRLIECNMYSDLSLDLRNSNLVFLEINDGDAQCNLSIDAPFLTTLIISCNVSSRSFELKDLSELKRVSLNVENMFKFGVHQPVSHYGRILTDVIRSFGHVEHIKLCRASLQLISCNDFINDRPVPFFKCTYLEVSTKLLIPEMRGLAYLLKWCSGVEDLKVNICCPDTEYLKDFLKGMKFRYQDDTWDSWKNVLWDLIGSYCVVLHKLKTVEIFGFPECDVEIHETGMLLATFLENLNGLESMIIMSSEIEQYLGEELLSFPKASQTAVIRFT